VAQHTGETCAAHTSIVLAVHPEHGAMHAHRQFQVLLIKRIIWESDPDLVAEAARHPGRHADRWQAICFEPILSLIWRGGVEMKADKEVGAMLLGESYAIGKCEIGVIGTRQKHGPAMSLEQGDEALCPVESIFLFQAAPNHAACAAVLTAMTGINNNDMLLSKGDRIRVQRQWHKVFLHVEC